MIKKISTFVFSLIVFVFATKSLQAASLRVATYNVWNPIFEEKHAGKNTWDERLPFILENLLSSQADIVCLEEIGKKQYLEIMLNAEVALNYISLYIPHAPKNEQQKEGRDGLAIFYKPERISLTRLVQSLDGSRPTFRRDFIADFKSKEGKSMEGKENPVRFRIAGIHIDADDMAVGNAQLSELVQDVSRNDEDLDFVVVCGDFNESEQEEARPRYEIMQQAGFTTDGSNEPTRPEAIQTRHKGHVDWIYFKKLSSRDFNLIPISPIGDERASDHKLTLTEIEIL